MTTTIKSKLILIPAITLVCLVTLTSFFGQKAEAYYAGCYADSSGTLSTACAGDTKDSDNNPINLSTDCYLAKSTPEHVSCTDLTTRITTPPGNVTLNTNPTAAPGHACGGGPGYTPVYTSIAIGCVGKGNPIADMVFAIIRLLSDGVGIVVIASIVVSGIQYTVSRGDPNATAKAIKRLSSSLIALLIYIFAYALLNYVIPAGFLK